MADDVEHRRVDDPDRIARHEVPEERFARVGLGLDRFAEKVLAVVGFGQLKVFDLGHVEVLQRR